MRKKNNRLHSEYIASLSNDLQRLKAKYDVMKLEFLRALRRINERNVVRANQAAAPTFVVSTKDSWEPVEDGKSGVTSAEKPITPIVEVDKVNNTVEETSSESATTLDPLQTDKPLGAEKIELELLNNQKLARMKLKEEEVNPSTVTSEAPDSDQTNHQDVINFFKSDEQSSEQHNLTTTTIELPATTEATPLPEETNTDLPEESSTTKLQEEVRMTKLPNRFLLDSDHLTIKPIESTPKPEKVELEKLIEPVPQSGTAHSNGIYQHISTVELEKLDEKSPRTPISTPAINVPSSASGEATVETTQPISETTQPNFETTAANGSPETEKPMTMVEAVEKMEKELMSPANWQKESEKMNKSK